MRRDEVEAAREQKKHMVVELRSLAARYDNGKPWSKPDAERRDYLFSEVEKINGHLAEVHRAELEEIRSGGSSNGFPGDRARAFVSRPSRSTRRFVAQASPAASGRRFPGRSSARSP